MKLPGARTESLGRRRPNGSGDDRAAVTRAGNRFGARARARRWSRRLRWFLFGLAGAAVVGSLVWVVFFSPLLAAGEVTVTGAKQVPVATVIRAAGVPMGEPLARLDVAAIEKRVTRIPAIRTVDVQRRPLHTVQLVVEERVPAAAMQRDGRYAVLDDEGVVFAASRLRPRGLPLVEGRVDKARLAAAGVLLQALPPELEERVRAIRFDSSAGIVLRLEEGRRVIWGDAGESERKAEVLAALLATKAAVYDVSVPSMPTTRR